MCGHARYFKSVVCWDLHTPDGCPRGDACAFYHDKSKARRATQGSPRARVCTAWRRRVAFEAGCAAMVRYEMCDIMSEDEMRKWFRFFVFSSPPGILNRRGILCLEHHLRGNAHVLEMTDMVVGMLVAGRGFGQLFFLNLDDLCSNSWLKPVTQTRGF